MTENVQIPGFGGKIDRHPDQCPLCHNKIIPTPRYGHLSGTTTERRLEIAYTCPSAKCEELFIAYFTGPDIRLAQDAFDLSQMLNDVERRLLDIMRAVDEDHA